MVFEEEAVAREGVEEWVRGITQRSWLGAGEGNDEWPRVLRGWNARGFTAERAKWALLGLRSRERIIVSPILVPRFMYVQQTYLFG